MMEAIMLIAVILGFSIAGLWGIGDIASSHITISTTRSAVIAQGSGMMLLVLCGIVFPLGGMKFSYFSFSSTLTILVGLGLLAGLGYFSLYKALQSSLPVGQVSSLIAGNYAVSTLLSWLMFRDASLPSVLLLLCGVVFVAGSGEKSSVFSTSRGNSFTLPALSGIVWAAVASLCLGTFNFCLGFASSFMGAWYVVLLGSRAISLLLLSFVSALSPDNGKGPFCWQRNVPLAVGVGVAEMTGLLFLCEAIGLSVSHLTMILAISSCSVAIPFVYSVCRGMRLSFAHVFSLILIIFSLATLKDLQMASLSLVLLVVSLIVWTTAFVLSRISARKGGVLARANETMSEGKEDLSCHITTEVLTSKTRAFISSASPLHSLIGLLVPTGIQRYRSRRRGLARAPPLRRVGNLILQPYLLEYVCMQRLVKRNMSFLVFERAISYQAIRSCSSSNANSDTRVWGHSTLSAKCPGFSCKDECS